jgi:hypothetical protein
MKAALWVAIGVILVWTPWASCSDGGLHQLKQINPNYDHPNKSVAFLLSISEYSADSWDWYHVELCSISMPNWEKAERCVRARQACEVFAPFKTDLFGTKRDINSDKFYSCFQERRPFIGPMELLHGSRILWRAGVALVATLVTGGFDATKGSGTTEWEEENRWWSEPLSNWMEEGQ